MKARIKFIVLIGSVIVSVAGFFWLLTTHGPLAPVGVQLDSTVRADLNPSVFGTGTVDARLSYAVGPIAPGRVLRVQVDQGDEVNAGQLLAAMDPVDLDGRVQAAKSTGARSLQAVVVADAQVAEAASRARLAVTNRDRDRALYEQSVISKQALDSSSSEAERAMAALGAARANARALKQDVGRVDAESQGLGSLRESLRIVSQPSPGRRDPGALGSSRRRKRHRVQLRAARARSPRSGAEG